MMLSAKATNAAVVRPAWREPMFYLVWCLPLMPMIAVAMLLHFATASSNALDPVQRMAQIQTLADAGDQQAVRWGLRGQLKIDPEGVHLNLVAGAESVLADFRKQSLALLFLHPTNAAKDTWLTLAPNSSGAWYAPSSALPDLAQAAHWRLRVLPSSAGCNSPSDCLNGARWQLHGDFSGASAGVVVLNPKFAAP